MDAVTTIRRTRTRTPPRRRRSTLSRRRLTVGSRRKQAAATPDRPQLRPRCPRAATTASCPPAPAARDTPAAASPLAAADTVQRTGRAIGARSGRKGGTEARPVARRTRVCTHASPNARPALHAHETLPCGLPGSRPPLSTGASSPAGLRSTNTPAEIKQDRRERSSGCRKIDRERERDREST